MSVKRLKLIITVAGALLSGDAVAFAPQTAAETIRIAPDSEIVSLLPSTTFLVDLQTQLTIQNLVSPGARLDRFLAFLQWTAILLILVSPVRFTPLTAMGFNFTILGLTVGLLCAALLVLRKGFRSAKYYLLSWTAMLLSIVAWSFSAPGSFQERFLVFYWPLVGSAVEVVLIAFALSDRMNTLRRQLLEVMANKAGQLQSELDYQRAQSDFKRQGRGQRAA